MVSWLWLKIIVIVENDQIEFCKYVIGFGWIIHNIDRWFKDKGSYNRRLIFNLYWSWCGWILYNLFL